MCLEFEIIGEVQNRPTQKHAFQHPPMEQREKDNNGLF